MKKKLEQGITDYKEFIDKNCYFVDKTHLIAYLIDHPSKVHLITRPRRFGKTLNLSMIRYFFEAPPPGGSADTPPNASLFDGMSISRHPQCREYMGKYPVISLSFKDVKESTHEDSMTLIKNTFSNEYRRHQDIQDSGLLNTKEQTKFTKISHNEGTDQDCAQSMALLSMWLHRIYKKPAYILLDEYDTPLHAAYSEGFYEKMIPFIRSFMVQTFKDNPHLMQGVVIGILKVAQESIFSDFNNPKVSTLIDTPMEDCFGFTEDEVKRMADHFELEEEMNGISEWYNGYIFGNNTVIYNPWSIVNYLGAPEAGMRPYWVNTSDNKLIREVMQMDKQTSRDLVSRLLQKKEVRKKVYLNIAYPEIRKNPDAAWSFLLHGGYLKATERKQVRTNITYNLSIPNMEVEYVYESIIQSWLKDELKDDDDYSAFVDGLRDLDPQRIETSLGRILFTLASHHDMAGKTGEMFYHGLLLGLLAYLGAEYTVESNREYGYGRADIVLISRALQDGRAEKAIVFELKYQSGKFKTSLRRLARKAHAQAVERYGEGVKVKCNPQQCLVLGVGFRGKRVACFSSFVER